LKLVSVQDIQNIDLIYINEDSNNYYKTWLVFIHLRINKLQYLKKLNQ